MNKILIALTVSAACFSFSAASNDNKITGPYVKLGINYFDFSSDRRFKSENNFYFGAGYQTSEKWGVEFEYTDLDTETKLSLPLSVDLWSVNSIYRPYPRSTNSVFWKMGLGRYGNVIDDETVGRFGVGYDFATSDNFSWIIGADTTLNSGGEADLIGYAGISYFFGQASSKPIPIPKEPPIPVIAKPKDSDMDSVVDRDDQCKTTPAGAKVDATGCRIILTEDVSIELQVQFANDSDVITDEYRQEIEMVASFMQQYPDTTVVVEGHTDDRGPAKYNQQLSQKRATAVMQYLVDNFSVASDRISAIGKGESYPVADNNTTVGRKTNRRVQAEIKTSVFKPK